MYWCIYKWIGNTNNPTLWKLIAAYDDDTVCRRNFQKLTSKDKQARYMVRTWTEGHHNGNLPMTLQMDVT